MSRAGSWAWGKCGDISAESLFPSPSCNRPNCCDDRKSLQHPFPLQPKSHVLDPTALRGIATRTVRPSQHTGPHLPRMYGQDILMLSPHTHFFFSHCVAYDICNLFPWKTLTNSVPFGGSSFPGNHLRGKGG